jgi:hypothetical protein
MCKQQFEPRLAAKGEDAGADFGSAGHKLVFGGLRKGAGRPNDLPRPFD